MLESGWVSRRQFRNLSLAPIQLLSVSKTRIVDIKSIRHSIHAWAHYGCCVGTTQLSGADFQNLSLLRANDPCFGQQECIGSQTVGVMVVCDLTQPIFLSLRLVGVVRQVLVISSNVVLWQNSQRQGIGEREYENISTINRYKNGTDELYISIQHYGGFEARIFGHRSINVACLYIVNLIMTLREKKSTVPLNIDFFGWLSDHAKEQTQVETIVM